MDFFKFTADPSTDLSKGVYFRGYDSSMWIERYRQPGAFEFKAPLSSGLREFLSLGSIISHTNTLEAAIVETHSVKEEKNKDPQIVITGQSIDILLAQRIVGMELAWNDPNEPFVPYDLAAATTAQQAKTLINDHIKVSEVSDPDNSLNDDILADAIAGTDTPEARTLKRQTVHKALMDILNIDDLGVRVIRRNPFGNLGNDNETLFYIHQGVDRSATISFDWEKGDLEDAEYLFSLKGLKDTALVHGRYMEEIVYLGTPTDVGDKRRVMLVDGSDIDEPYSDTPQPWSGTIRNSIRAAMQARGKEALAGQTIVDIASVDVTTPNKFAYRTDYDIGDIVTVAGNYQTTAKRRVVEYVEIEDKNGFRSYPTLSALDEAVS